MLPNTCHLNSTSDIQLSQAQVAELRAELLQSANNNKHGVITLPFLSQQLVWKGTHTQRERGGEREREGEWEMARDSCNH